MKKYMFLSLSLLLTAALLAGCSLRKSDGTPSGNSQSSAASSAESSAASSGTGSLSAVSSTVNTIKMVKQAGDKSNACNPDTDSTSGNTAWIPSEVITTLSESKPDAKLAKAIANYFGIPDTGLSQTKYYYNYVDLNNDKTNEILALVIGPYSSGSAGDTLLWILPNADYAVSQALALANAPIIVSDQMVNGAHQLIVPRMGGGAKTEYVSLVCDDGSYTSISDAKAVSNLSEVTGKAIICNDIIRDVENNTALTLAD